MTGRAVGIAGCFRRQTGIACDVLGSGGHLGDRGSHQLDFGQLFLHPVIGAHGDIGGIFRRIRHLLHRADHLADHALQLVEKGIETCSDGTELVSPLHRQAPGQVPVTPGDLIQHADQLTGRPRQVVPHQQHHPEPRQGDQYTNDHQGAGSAGLLLGELGVQRGQVRHHHIQGQAEQQRPAGGGVPQGHGHPQLDEIVGPVHFIDGLFLQLPQVGLIDAVENRRGRLPRRGPFTGPGDQSAIATDQGLLALAVKQVAIAALEHRLQKIHRQVGADDSQELAVEQNRSGEGRQHDLLVAQLIGSRVDDAGASRFPGTQIVLARPYPGVQQGFIVQFAEQVQGNAAISLAVPVGNELPFLAVPGQPGVGVEAVEPVEGAGLPGYVSCQQVGPLFQHLTDIAQHLVPADHQLRQPVPHVRRLTIEQRQLLVDHQRLLELLADTQHLAAGHRLQPLAYMPLQQLLGALGHQGLIALEGQQGIEGHRPHRHEETSACQGGDGQLY